MGGLSKGVTCCICRMNLKSRKHGFRILDTVYQAHEYESGIIEWNSRYFYSWLNICSGEDKVKSNIIIERTIFVKCSQLI